MELSLQQIFDQARAAGDWIPAPEAEVIFAGAVRLAVEQGAPLRPSRVLIGDAGTLSLAAPDDGDDRPGTLAPELSLPDPPRRTEGRVQVFAAGALAYELFTGRQTPPAPHGTELSGPLADVVRVALSADRRERFGDLQQLLDAVEVIQPRRPEQEAAALTALWLRVRRWEAQAALPATAEKVEDLAGQLSRLDTQLTRQAQALARLAEQEPLGARVAALEAALQSFKGQYETSFARLTEAVQKAQAARAAAEQRAREDAETREALAALHPPPSAFAKALGPALLGAVIAAGATAVVLLFLFPALGGARPVPAHPQQAASAPPAPPPAPAAGSAAAGELALAPPAQPSGQGAAAPPAAGAAPAAAVEPPPAAPSPAAAAAPDAPPKPAAPPAEVKGTPADAPPPAEVMKHPPSDGSKSEPGTAQAKADPPAKAEPAARHERSRDAGAVSPAMIARAVARSQVDRGDTALEKGRADEAIEKFRAALENDPELASAHRGLGMAYALKNLDEKARKEYERYLQLAPAAEDAADIRKAIEELRARSKLGGDDK